MRKKIRIKEEEIRKGRGKVKAKREGEIDKREFRDEDKVKKTGKRGRRRYNGE